VAKAYRISRPLPNVSAFAAPFVDEEPDEEPASPEFQRYVTARQTEAEQKQHRAGRRVLRWAIYTVLSFIVATRAPGWWSFLGWWSTIAWGTGTLFALEAWNVERIVSSLEPD
jgi:hypothetical protein